MNLFEKKKKKETTTCGCASEQPKVSETECCEESANGIYGIKVLGAGCKSCNEQFGYVKEAARSMELDVEVEYITDMQKVMTYGAMSMPAIVINEKVVSMGKVLKTDGVKKLLQKFS